MRGQSLGAAGLLLVAGVGLFAVATPAQPPAKEPPLKVESKPVVWPGLQPDGSVQLPNQWSLKPTGRHLEVGDFPVNIALHPTGEFAAVLCAGFGAHEILIVDLNPERTRVLSRVQINQAFYGLTWSNDGRQIFASGGEEEIVHVFDFDKGYLVKGKTLDVSVPKRKGVVGGIAFDPAGKDLFAAIPWADAIVRVPLVNPDNKKVIAFEAEPAKKEPGKGEPPSPPDGRKDDAKKDDPEKPKEPQVFPYACLVEPGGKRCFVSLWAKAAVAVIDLEKNAVVAKWATAEHPTEMLLSPKGDALYVACANSTKVSVIDPATGKPLQTINCALLPGGAEREHAEQPRHDARRRTAVRRQRGREQPERVRDCRPRRGEARRVHPDRLVSHQRAVQRGRQVTLRRQRQGHVVEVESRRAEPDGAAGAQPERIHRAAPQGHAQRDAIAHAGADDPTQQDRVRVQPAPCRQRRADRGPRSRQPYPRERRRPQPHQVLHLHREGEPHLRSDLRRHQGGQRRTATVPLPGGGHAEPPQAGEAVRAARQLLRGRRGVRRRARVDDGRLRHRLRGEDLAAQLPRRKDLRLPQRGRLRPHREGRAAATCGTSATTRR